MKIDNNILQRARNFDLTESELEALYSDPKKLDKFYDDTLVSNITEDLFIPGNTELLDQKKKEIANLTKKGIRKPQKSRVVPLKVLGIAASIILLVGTFFLIKPSPEISEIGIVEFSKISSSTYSPEAIASLERSTENQEHIELVTAYHNKDYDLILEKTAGKSNNAEISLLRARVLMDLNRYEEGYEIMKVIDEKELLQKDVYLWMMAEGALGSGDEGEFIDTKEKIISSKLPGLEKLKTDF